jgi:CRP-like cAMP-binding protein
MPLDWLNTPLDADIGELLARKKRAKAIETLRRQLQGRLAPPVAVRLQLADLLMQAGRVEEAVPVLLGLAEEFAADGFVAKAVAILKRVDRVQPGRPDVAERLEKLVHQQKRVTHLPSRPRSAMPEFGIEEIGDGRDFRAAEQELAAPEGEAAPAVAAEPAGSVAVPAGYEEAVELPAEPSPAAEESVRRVEAVTVEPVAEPEAGLVEPIIEAAAVDAEPIVEATDARTEGAEGPPVDGLVVAVSGPDVPDEPILASHPSETPGEPALADDSESPAPDAQKGVGKRIRRALWRFLASLPGGEEGTAMDAQAIPSPTAEDGASEGLSEPSAAHPDERADTPPAAPARPVSPGEEARPSEVEIEFEPPPPRVDASVSASLAEAPGEPATEPLGTPAVGEEAMSEEAFRHHLLDIVEDVLHRPPPPQADAAMDRARVLDLARRMVASRLFRDLSDEELLAIVRGLRLRIFDAGDIVVTEGEPGQSLFTLATGRVKVFVANPDGRNFEVAALAEGDFFGEISSLSGRPRSATVVAASACELLELDRPTLDSIARTHARVRDVLEASYIERASSPEAAAVRSVTLPDSGTRRKAIEVLEAHFGESRWDPRMRLRLADVLLKAGKDEDAIAILIGLADDLAREGFADKAVAILKKIEQVQRRNVEVVNLAPLLRAEPTETRAADGRASPSAGPGAAPRPRAVTDDRFHGWLVDLVRDTVGNVQKPSATGPAAHAPAVKAYGPGLLANPLFEDFSEEELLAFIHGLKLLAFEPGDVIITEGEPGQSVFILTTGQVKVFVRGPDHRSVLLGALGEGSFFGEISTLSGRPRSATITAASACEILELDRAGLDAISASHPRVRSVLESFSAARSADAEAARARGGRAPE